MYSYSGLGNYGRLGNQMFQYAALKSLSSFHGVPGFIPEGDLQLYSAFPNLSLQKLPANEIMEKAKYKYTACEEYDFRCDASFFCLRDDTDITGYFQSPLYFHFVKDGIYKEFTFSKDVQETCRKKYRKIKDVIKSAGFDDYLTCAIHIRRTDYLSKPDFHHNLSLEEYYQPAMKAMLSKYPNTTFIIFSDDYRWCKENLPAGVIYSFHFLCV